MGNRLDTDEDFKAAGRVRLEIQEIIARGRPVTLEEWKGFVGNSWEHEVLVPKLGSEAFRYYVEHTLKNCQIDRRRPFTTYNDSAIGLVIPELLRRLDEATKPPLREQKHRTVFDLSYEADFKVQSDEFYLTSAYGEETLLYEVTDTEMATVCYVADKEVGELICQLLTDCLNEELSTREQDYPFEPSKLSQEFVWSDE